MDSSPKNEATEQKEGFQSGEGAGCLPQGPRELRGNHSQRGDR